MLDEALKSVEKHSGKKEDEAPAPAPSRPADPHSAPAPTGDAPPADAASGDAAPVAPKEPRDDEIESLKLQVEFSMAKGRELMGKIKDEHEKMLRAVADLENYKKRAVKEKEEMQKFGNEKLLKDFLPVFDNFDRALDAAKSAADFESLRKGVEMTRKLFEDTLGKHGVRAFSAKGQVFDPNRHEAMTAAETTDMPPNHVFNEVLRGFTLNDRLVRPALVIVSRTPAAPATVPSAAPSSATGNSETPPPPVAADGDGTKPQ